MDWIKVKIIVNLYVKRSESAAVGDSMQDKVSQYKKILSIFFALSIQ